MPCRDCLICTALKQFSLDVYLDAARHSGMVRGARHDFSFEFREPEFSSLKEELSHGLGVFLIHVMARTVRIAVFEHRFQGPLQFPIVLGTCHGRLLGRVG